MPLGACFHVREKTNGQKKTQNRIRGGKSFQREKRSRGTRRKTPPVKFPIVPSALQVRFPGHGREPHQETKGPLYLEKGGGGTVIGGGTVGELLEKNIVRPYRKRSRGSEKRGSSGEAETGWQNRSERG